MSQLNVAWQIFCVFHDISVEDWHENFARKYDLEYVEMYFMRIVNFKMMRWLQWDENINYVCFNALRPRDMYVHQ